MKKFKKFAFIFLILVIVILSFMIYTSIAKDQTIDVKDKVMSEIKYFESQIVNIFNSLNNIEFENYKISVEDISKNSKEFSKSSSSAGSTASDSGGGESSSGSDTGDSSSSSSSSGNKDGNSTSSDKVKKYSLNSKGVLNSDSDINWEYIKSEVEILNSSLSTMTLDLYEISLNGNDIVNFNKEYDKLLLEIKNENKENTLKELNIIYSYLPKFIKNCNPDEQYKIIIDTKQNIFNAYGILDTGDWDTINNYLKSSNESFSKLLTDVNIYNKNQYSINKCYVLINDLQNSVINKDKEIFLIKYKNLLEELNNL